jgi:hypothetical protein
MINAGKFELIGTYTENKGGQGTMIKVSVGDPADPKAMPKTYRVGLTKTMTNEILGNKIKMEAVNSDGSIKYPDLYAAGEALLPGSAYNKINKTKMGTAAKIFERVATPTGLQWVQTGKVEKSRSRATNLPTIVATDMNGNPIDGLLQDQMQIGTYLQDLERNPSKYQIKY